MVDLLRQAGYQVEYPYLDYPTGFRGVLKTGEGPSVALLVEYDALPVVGHACGHNVHGSMSILAAMALAQHKELFQGTLYVVGTPAEETAGAKVGMAAQGAFDGMDLAIMIHSWSGGSSIPDQDVLSLGSYDIRFLGRSAHAAGAPWAGHNALTAARKFLDLLDACRESFTSDIRVSSIITSGGRATNVIPDQADVRMEYRTDSQRKLKELDETVHACAQGAAMALKCQVEFQPTFDSFMDMVRVPALEEYSAQLIGELGRTIAPVTPPMGSSDVGNVSYHCPAIQPLLTIGDTFYALHTPEFREETLKEPAHQAIADGGKLIGSLVLRTLTDEKFRDQVRQSYLAQREKKLDP